MYKFWFGFASICQKLIARHGCVIAEKVLYGHLTAALRRPSLTFVMPAGRTLRRMCFAARRPWKADETPAIVTSFDVSQLIFFVFDAIWKSTFVPVNDANPRQKGVPKRAAKPRPRQEGNGLGFSGFGRDCLKVHRDFNHSILIPCDILFASVLGSELTNSGKRSRWFVFPSHSCDANHPQFPGRNL